MEVNEIYARIGSLCVVPVIAIENPDAALPLADALLEGGLPIAEITFRTAAAAALAGAVRGRAVASDDLRQHRALLQPRRRD